LSDLKNILICLLLSWTFQGTLHAQVPVATTKEENGEEMPGSGCGGVERWDEKVLVDSHASQVNYTPVFTTIDSLINIPTIPNASAPRMPGIEFQAYRIKCSITVKKNESDDDYHLVLVDGNESMIGEVPDPTCPVAATSAHLGEFLDARNWVSSHIGIDPIDNVNIALVEVTGIAFVDVPHGQTGAAPNQMEIHPILKIQFADNSGINDGQGSAPAFKVTVAPASFSEKTVFHLTSDHSMFGNCRLEVYSLNGEKVRNTDIPVNNKKDVSYTFYRNALLNGMYIYRILNNNSTLYEGKIILK